ncbi:MAG TPA: signal recognition particle-docking protein FtsY [Nitrososphaeraceae archaeon]|nr:signal recognition particle-docking protein FtsY [Nitrososphaeraceae archaeon]
MFEKLRKIFSETAKNLGQKSISKKDIDSILDELQISLMENDVAHEIVDDLTSKIKTEILELKLERNENSDAVITTKLYSFLHELFMSTNVKTDIVQAILDKKKSKSGPYSIVFLGINGTGKTTTVAKFCKLLRDKGISVILAAADTHRAGAIEQITQHGNNLNVKVISQRYGADPSAVARDALEHAKKNYIEAVLIDTAGRMQTSKNLMEEVSKIIRVIKPDMKIFVGDSLAGNDTVNQAREFFEYTKYDGSILTKSDADSKGGAAISIAYLTHKPILYLGMGQGYGDLEEFDHERFLDSIFKDKVYDKTGKILTPSNDSKVDNTSKAQPVIEIPNMNLASDNAKLESPSSNVDKVLETVEIEKQVTLPQTSELSPTKSDDDQKFDDRLNHFTEEKAESKTESKTKIIETKPKGGLFKKIFKDDKDKKDTDDSKQSIFDKVDTKKEMNKKENKSKNKSEPEKENEKDDEVVYLTDDDINDLIK